MSILKDFSYRNTSINQNPYMTYHAKLKNEIENIPQMHKKFFIKSLARYKFDLDVYVPQSNEKNRKVYPDKDYLLNKIILYDNTVNKYKQRINTISKDFSKFFKFYQYLKSNNSRQRDYMNKLVSLYKEKNSNNEDLEYKANENIFTESVLLESQYDQSGNYNEFFRKYGETNGKKLLKNDEKILIKLDRVIHHKRSPNSIDSKKRKNIRNFITGINQSDYINKNDKTETSIENIENKEEKYETIKKEIIKSSNKKVKFNNLDKYIVNSKLMNLKKIKQNKYNYNYDLKANESNKKNFNFQKSNLDLNDEVEHKNQINRIARLKKLFLNIYRKDELFNKNNHNIEKQEAKADNDVNDNSKYLLTTLKKMNGRNKTDDLLEINKDKILKETYYYPNYY